MVKRCAQNPLIRVSDVRPSRPDFQVIGTFNAGTAVFNGKRILLVRVAEMPVQSDPRKVPVPIFNCSEKKSRCFCWIVQTLHMIFLIRVLFIPKMGRTI